jgi:O-antigen ligase
MKKIINWLFFTYLVIFPFGQLTRLPNLFPKRPEVHWYLTDIILFLLILCWVLKIFIEKKRVTLPPLAKPICIFAGISLISLMVNIKNYEFEEFLIAWLYWWRWLAYGGLYFIAYDFKKYIPLKSLVVVGGAAAVFGLIQYFFWPDLSSLEALNWDPHYYRLTGTWLDPGFTGIILVLSLILWWGTNQAGGIWVGVLLYLSLALTYSRSSLLALFMAVAFYSWLKKNYRPVILITVLLVATILCLPRSPGGEGVKLERVTSAKSRLENWQQTITIFKQKPILGIGFNVFRYAQDGSLASHAAAGSDSSLLLVLATTGMIGLAAYLGYWWKIFSLSLSKKTKPFSLVVLSSAVALLTHSWFNNTLFYPWVMGWWALILGII